MIEFLPRNVALTGPRRRIDKREQTLVVARRIVIVAILRADIDRRRGRQATAREDVVEFRAIIAREKHIMPNERKALRPSVYCKRHGRKRWRRATRFADDRARFGPEEAGAQRRHIAIHDHCVGPDDFAIVERDPGRPTGFDVEARDIASLHEYGAPRPRQIRQRAGEPMHAVGDAPYAVHFHMGDQHQRRRRGKGRRSAVGRVAPEKLSQSLIAEIFAKLVPHCCEGRDAQKIGQAAKPRVAHKMRGAWTLRENEGITQGFVNALGARAEATKVLSFRMTRESGDCIDAAFGIREQVEAFAVAPCMTCEDLRALKAHAIVQTRARLIEDFVENPAHGENGRTGVELSPARLNLAELASGRGGALDHGHVVAARGKQDGGDEPADSSPDDNHALRSHGFAFRLAPARRG